jgi:hypothetical protein
MDDIINIKKTEDANMKNVRTGYLRENKQAEKRITLVRGKGGFFWISMRQEGKTIKHEHLFSESVFKTIYEAQQFLSKWNKVHYSNPIEKIFA